MKQRQQKELAENIINKIGKELENPKVLNQILQQSVADVERKLVFSLSCLIPMQGLYPFWVMGGFDNVILASPISKCCCG